MRLPPADVLLSWPPPNYENPKTRGDALLIVNSVLIGFTIITVALRLYTRIVIKRWFGIDDVFILLALVFTIGLTAVVLLANQRYGWDRHIWDIPFAKFVPNAKIAMTAKLVFTAAATFTRLSLHCFYYRLVEDAGKSWFRWLVHINVAYTVGIFISFPFIAVFLCTPVQAYWDLDAAPGACLDEGVATLVCGIISCVADFATTVTPMPLVFSLHMPRRQRFAVALLFGLGFIVTIAGVVRTWYIYRSLFGEYDQTWYAYPLWIAAAIEIDLGVICASAPVLRPLLAKIPISLSDTFSRGISLKNSSQQPSSGLPTPLGSRPTPNTSVLGSRRKSEAIRAVPELTTDGGKSYELKEWDDLEPGTRIRETSRGSQEAIFGQGEATPSKGFQSMWKKNKSSENTSELSITKTSEVELRVSTISGANRWSRHSSPAKGSLP